MHIIVIGSVRTKSTALLSYLHKIHPDHINLSEYFYPLTIEASWPIIKDKRQFITPKLCKLLETIFQNKNILLKILGSNLFGMYQYIDQINLKKFDEIHLTERNDFFDQVCSIVVARKERVYHKYNDNKELYKNIQTKKYSVSKNPIMNTAHDIFNYIKIKKYLLENDIKFTKYSYEDLREIHDIPITPNNLNYNSIVENYFLKEKVNSIFSESFNYNDCNTDIETFSKKIENLLF